MRRTIILSALLLSVATYAQADTNYEVRYATNPTDTRSYDTKRFRSEYLVQDLFGNDEVNMVYTMHDRMIMGGAKPVNQALKLEPIEPIKSSNFTAHREVGVINIGGKGVITVGNKRYDLNYQDALYIGRGSDEVTFYSTSSANPAMFYFNSATSHAAHPTKKITKAQAPTEEAGSMEAANARVITKYISKDNVQTSQLTMGMTELKKGSVWNTMPPHTHGRRMEAYFYYDLPEEGSIAHFMGEADKTKNIWVHNLQGIISPEWSIHAGAGTSNYNFIWGMAGENLDYTDLDKKTKLELE